MSKTLLDQITYFNRKERYLLVRSLLPADQLISPAFLERINCLPGIEILPTDYWAIDYHLDWLYAALMLYGDHGSGLPVPIASECFKASQEDMDLLLVAVRPAHTDLVLIEAKATTGWENEQLRSKAQRLGAIFGKEGQRWPGVCPHFVLMSPHKPGMIDTTNWPDWTKHYQWIELPTEQDSYGQITRCDAGKQPSVNGTHWTVIDRHYV